MDALLLSLFLCLIIDGLGGQSLHAHHLLHHHGYSGASKAGIALALALYAGLAAAAGFYISTLITPEARSLFFALALEPEPGSLDAFSAFWQPQILALRLNASMVYLSACETSRGKFYQGQRSTFLRSRWTGPRPYDVWPDIPPIQNAKTESICCRCYSIRQARCPIDHFSGEGSRGRCAMSTTQVARSERESGNCWRQRTVQAIAFCSI